MPEPESKVKITHVLTWGNSTSLKRQSRSWYISITIYIFVFIYLYLSLYIYKSIYFYIFTHNNLYLYLYFYIFIYNNKYLYLYFYIFTNIVFSCYTENWPKHSKWSSCHIHSQNINFQQYRRSKKSVTTRTVSIGSKEDKSSQGMKINNWNKYNILYE